MTQNKKRQIGFFLKGNESPDVLEHLWNLIQALQDVYGLHLITAPHLKHYGIHYFEKIHQTNCQHHVLHAQDVFSSASLQEIKKIVLENNIPIFHSFDDHNTKMSQMQKLLKGVAAHIQTIFDHRLYLQQSKIDKVFTKKIFKQSHYTIWTSEQGKALLSDQYKFRRASLIHPGDKIPESRDVSTKPCVLFVGPLTAVSACHELLNAFSLVSAGREQVMLHICGEGPEKDVLKQKVQSLSLESKVVFLDETVSLDEEFARATVFVQPGGKEVISSFLLKAMSYAKPIVLQDLPIHRECLFYHESALFVRNKDPYNLAMALKSFLDDEEKSKVYGQHVFENFKARFLLDTMIDKHKNLYRLVFNQI